MGDVLCDQYTPLRMGCDEAFQFCAIEKQVSIRLVIDYLHYELLSRRQAKGAVENRKRSIRR